VEAAGARERAAHAAAVPDVGLSAGEMHMFRSPSPAEFLFLGVQINLPLFGGKNRARETGAAAARTAAEAQAHAVEPAVLADGEDALAEVRAEARQTELHPRLIPLSRQASASA